MNTIATSRYREPRSLVLLGVFLAVVVGVGGLIGANTAPGTWYEQLTKPPFNPPNWLFGPVWFTLYLLIAIAGWRTFLRDPRGRAMQVWFGQMALNWLWSPVWFTLHLVWPAFAIITLLFAAIIGFIAITWRTDRVSALLFLPYAAWVGFASVLNFSIGVLN